MLRRLRRIPLEAAVWTAGLAAMAWMDPATEGPSFCLLSWLDVSFCPGCGLGHAIAHLARGAWALSFEAHPLALPVVLALGWRVVTLVRQAAHQPVTRNP